jgi:hypothetical protein
MARFCWFLEKSRKQKAEMKKRLLQGCEGILSALTPAAEIAAPRGRVTLPERTFAECYCRICGIFSAPRSGLGMAGAKQRQKGPCL